ncbi:MAG: hypothetical protein IAG10_31195, partial [Planctomycetaceae bacterium]|nr:hypothetical protein [Planctomycetaceae bacterium]
QASFLFTGDLEEPAIETLLSRFAGTSTLDVDVWEVGHHGSYNGVTQGMLTAMSPQVAVISMGPETAHVAWSAWAYGHPRRSVVELLDATISRPRDTPASVLVADKVKSFTSYTMRDAIYGTGWDGDIIVSSGADGVLRVETHR